jgi:uncharacterized OsmC-like protein
MTSTTTSTSPAGGSAEDRTAVDAALAGISEATAAAVGAEPTAAKALFSVAATNPASVLTRVTSRGHTIDIDEPPSLGGDDTAINPVETALAALAACQVVTYRFHATRLGVRVDAIDISAEGDLDVQGFFALDDATRPGFTAVRFHVELTGPDTVERYEELRAEVDAHCPVLDLFRNPTPVTSSLGVSAG